MTSCHEVGQMVHSATGETDARLLHIFFLVMAEHCDPPIASEEFTIESIRCLRDINAVNHNADSMVSV